LYFDLRLNSRRDFTLHQ